MKKFYFSRLKKTLVFLLLFVFLLLLATACTGGQEAAAPKGPPLKVTWNSWPGNYPIVIAQELGLFEKHGIAVESILSDSYDTMAPDFIERKTDAVLFTLVDALIIDAREPDSGRVVLVLDESDGADVVIAESGIANVAGLKGKRIGASSGSFGELLVRDMLEKNNLTLDEVTMVDIGPENVAGAIPDSIQAGFTFDVFTGGHPIIFSSAEAPGLIVDVAIFSTEVTEKRPEDVRAFIAAWFEAVDYWLANPEKGNEFIAKALDIPAEEISLVGLKLLSKEDNLHAFTPGTDTTSLYFSGQVNADFLISTGGLTAAPDLERLLTPAFLK